MLDNLQQFEPTLIKLAKTYKIPPLEWEDIAQELRLHLWLKEKNRKKSIKDYNNWAYIVCRRKLIDLARKYNKKIKTISFEELREKGIEIEG